MTKKEKVTVSLDASLVAWADDLVERQVFESRSAAIEQAIEALLLSVQSRQYEDALALLDPVEERAWAEEGMADYSRAVMSTTEWEGARDEAI